MDNILNLITLDVRNEHDLEHDLEHNRNFSEPKIYDANGDLNKRWYVYFSFKDPKTGKLKRMKNIYGKANSYNTKEARYYLLGLYKRRLLKFLKSGYNPFQNNTSLYLKHKSAIKPPQQNIKKSEPIPVVKNPDVNADITSKKTKTTYNSMPVKNAIDYALKLKTNVVSERTLADYTNYFQTFTKWLNEHHKNIITIGGVSKIIVVKFLNHVQLKSSARNRNNYRTCFSSIFQTMEDNEIIKQNFIKSIPKLKTVPKRNKTYSEQQKEAIFDYLKDEDPTLLLFIKFVSYNFLRPKEVCRLQIKDIDLVGKTVQFQAKNKALQTKLIPDILIEDLPDISNMNEEFLLFTPDGIGGYWDAELENRRDYFTKRFKKVVKDHFKLDKNYGLYSFKHTFITKLYRSLVKESSPFAAKSKLMQITGHSTMLALEKYLREIDAELPEDYSNLLK